MDPTAALITGLAAGIAIAMQFGAVSLLLVETAVAGGPRAGIAAGMGVATVDLLFAAAAAAAGATVGSALTDHETELRLVAAATLIAIAVHGLIGVRKNAAKTGAGPVRTGHVRAHYARFFAITLLNPLTIVSFAAVASSVSLDDASTAVAFAAGVGAASAGWHLALTAAAGHAGRWITPRIQRGLAVGGRVAVLLIAAHLATSA